MDDSRAFVWIINGDESDWQIPETLACYRRALELQKPIILVVRAGIYIPEDIDKTASVVISGEDARLCMKELARTLKEMGVNSYSWL